MALAIVLGSGPEVDFLLSVRERAPKPYCFFGTNFSHNEKVFLDHDIPTLNLLDDAVTVSTLHRKNITRIVAVGSFKVKGAYFDARTPAAFSRLLTLFSASRGGSDASRMAFFSATKDHFQFPPLKVELPCLFADVEIAINRDDDLCKQAMAESANHLNVDAVFYVGGRKVKVFRVPSSDSNNLINRHLDPKKLEDGLKGSVTHYFFETDRTILVNIEAMKSFAFKNKLTLQSFQWE